jgi:hypothetical protein
MSGAQIAAEVTAALAGLASEIGNGSFPITLLRPQGNPATPWEPSIWDDEEVPLIGNVMMYRRSLIDGTLIKDGDRRVMIAANGPVPSTSDRLRIAGTDYSIVNVEPYEPQGVVLYFNVQARV